MQIGKLLKPWGVKGQMKAVLAADMSEGMFMPVNAVVLSGGAALNIASKTFRHDCVILKFDGIDTPEEAALYNNMTMEAEGVEMPPLEDGQYYIEDIIGLDVIAASGEALGKVSDVLSFPANDVYVMQYAERECLIPAIADVIKEINIVGGYIKINVIEGLL